LAIVPSCPAPDDRLGHRTRHRGRIGERMIEVQNPHGLTEGIDHVVIAISMERIAAIVAGDRDRYAAGIGRMISPPFRDLAHLEVWKHVTAEQVDVFQARLMGIELPTRSVEA
jgi:hypothetical protein